ncbi:hypothetical protein DMN91_011073 [Ooceraea biroi]|uniref:NADH dehydrogenase [ubiquinone] 1 beta subcomplex subunit 4 n=1 Tax=Ooceraea biroi TaxID=2015173 RepID=A0A026X2T6_OOCBI|nr:uncharacterized protein LOC105277231 [Ooceraea biroi]EZA62331.1 hypothetical protein X777_03365 [Ooceraea biroi]RLU17004.1 hypothetical protein DMN91_011073 [Ooceraea biroi]
MDTNKVYDVTQKQKEVALWRDAKRQQLRELYLRDSGHPTKHLLFDQGMFRYGAARTTLSKFYMPTAVNFLIKTAMVFVPIFSLYYFFETTRGAQELRYRTGQVSYADRHPKFV